MKVKLKKAVVIVSGVVACGWGCMELCMQAHSCQITMTTAQTCEWLACSPPTSKRWLIGWLQPPSMSWHLCCETSSGHLTR